MMWMEAVMTYCRELSQNLPARTESIMKGHHGLPDVIPEQMTLEQTVSCSRNADECREQTDALSSHFTSHMQSL
jgi:hypothetical protein